MELKLIIPAMMMAVTVSSCHSNCATKKELSQVIRLMQDANDYNEASVELLRIEMYRREAERAVANAQMLSAPPKHDLRETMFYHEKHEAVYSLHIADSLNKRINIQVGNSN